MASAPGRPANLVRHVVREGEDLRTTYSSSFTTLLGHPEQSLADEDLVGVLISPGDLERTHNVLRGGFEEGQSLTHPFICADGRELWFEHTLAASPGGGAIIVSTPTSALRQLADRVAARAAPCHCRLTSDVTL